MILSYCRVSTAEQAADGTTSLAEQDRKTRALASMRGADPFEVIPYVDAGVSGSIPLGERPEGAKLLAEAKEGDCIVSSKLDRLFRSASDALTTVEDLKAKGIDLVLLDIGITPVGANGVGKLFFTILSACAEFERERIAERMTDGRRCKRERNGHTGGSAPYGFKVIGMGRSATLEPVHTEQVVIAQIKALSKDGKLAYQIAHELNKLNYRTRRQQAWKATQVERILGRALEETTSG